MCSSWGGGKNKESESNGLRGDELQNCILKTPVTQNGSFQIPSFVWDPKRVQK